MISWEDDRCVRCNSHADIHETILKQYGVIKYVVPLKPMKARWVSSEEIYPTEPMPYEIRECREFVKSFELFDRDGNPIERWPPYNNMGI